MKYASFFFLFVTFLSAQAQMSADDHFKAGLLYQKTEEYIKSISEFTKAISHNPLLAEAFYQRAKVKSALAHKNGFKNNELCGDLIEAMKMGHTKARDMMEAECTTECYSLETAKMEPEIVYCGDFNSNILHELPTEFFKMNNLVKVNMFNNRLTEMGDVFGEHKALINIDLSSNRIKTISPKIKEIKYLDELNLNKNELATLPTAFGELKKLRKLFLRSNNFYVFPDALYKCENLEELDLSLNTIIDISEEIQNLKNLKVINLIGNKLSGKSKKNLKKYLPNTTIYMD